ncbi:hypothetical protein BD31_I0844 [Candidatus Nitrosopumilus salaria BD31]|uniref:Uncharacterized protein n=1 Tax=Candidatus Nitrosopumilus salarius BD31 TaxID=859350 RepID=I3D216_9ARCH|nr:hypothetical protein [Candidatus Nitrosopumilus salaria]EIJ65759.1 hypothetical protein BD31_I0844 [Candidatus Nitrosopumilus salaria BD31]
MSKYSKPVWQMIVDTFQNNDSQEYADLKEISSRVKIEFPSDDVNKMTLRLQTIFHCVNHPGNRHDASKRFERNPQFHFDGKSGFRLLAPNEIKKYTKSS